MMDGGVNGGELRTWLVEYLTPVLEQTQLATARRGRPRNGGITEEIALTVKDWQDGNERVTMDHDADGDESDRRLRRKRR